VLSDAIEHYHDLLKGDLAADTQDQLDRQQRSRGLSFGERPLCTVLRPRFLTPRQYAFLQSRCRVLLQAFANAQAAALADEKFRKQFGLHDWEESLVREDPGFACAYPTSRLDAFFVSENDLHFTEFNAETPAGTAYNDALTEVFLALPAMAAFRRKYQVRPLPARPGVLAVLRDAFRQWSGKREFPRIAILDWPEVPTYSEFLLYQDYFRSQGLECIIADPREVEYRNGRLLAGDFHITLIYKRVLISELYERCGLDHPVVRAIRERAVCMVNPFPCKILYKKASFAVLTDERNDRYFSPEERQVIAAHIPWTRRVEERKTVHHGQRVDLVPYILSRRERFVLKPNDEYGGKGIVLGWTVDAAAWEKAVRDALTETFVVQERVNLPHEPYPSLINARVELIDRMLDTNPFVYGGEYVDGCLTRISTDPLVNVTAGGGSTVPTLLVDERP
jgi:uncharacterized circularly permuted ATP-grasp superfamily protein